MAEKIFKVEVPDGQHLGRAKGSDGEYRGLLFDDDNNLVGHAELSEVDGDDTSSSDDYPFEPSDSDGELDVDAIIKGLETLVDLAVILAAVAEAAAPHVKRWWNERGRRSLHSGRQKVVSSWNKLARRSKKEAAGTGDGVVTEVDAVPASVSAELVDSYQDLRVTMSSTEARQRFVAALLAQEFADAQMRMLRSARIEDPQDRPLEFESAVQSLTPGQVSDVIEQLLARNPQLIEQETLAALGRMVDSPSHALPASLQDPDIEAALSITSGAVRR